METRKTQGTPRPLIGRRGHRAEAADPYFLFLLCPWLLSNTVLFPRSNTSLRLRIIGREELKTFGDLTRCGSSVGVRCAFLAVASKLSLSKENSLSFKEGERGRVNTVGHRNRTAHEALLEVELCGRAPTDVGQQNGIDPIGQQYAPSLWVREPPEAQAASKDNRKKCPKCTLSFKGPQATVSPGNYDVWKPTGIFRLVLMRCMPNLRVPPCSGFCSRERITDMALLSSACAQFTRRHLESSSRT